MHKHTVSFHVGVPLILGLFFGFSQSGSEPLQGVTGHLAYWLISTFVSWQLLALGSKGVAVVAKPLNAPLFLVLLFGFAIGIFLWGPVSQVRDLLLGGLVVEGETLSGYTRYSDLATSISNWLLGASLWISTNYFYLYVLGAPRFGYKPDSQNLRRFRGWLFSNLGQSPKPVEQPRLLERLKAGQAAEVLALIAEDHYTRVLMPDREELIYLRFSDAVRDMDDYPGLQVHRSYWVSLSAAASYREEGHRAFLTLSNGMSVPVSRSFRRDVKQALA